MAASHKHNKHQEPPNSGGIHVRKWCLLSLKYENIKEKAAKRKKKSNKLTPMFFEAIFSKPLQMVTSFMAVVEVMSVAWLAVSGGVVACKVII